MVNFSRAMGKYPPPPILAPHNPHPLPQQTPNSTPSSPNPPLRWPQLFTDLWSNTCVNCRDHSISKWYRSLPSHFLDYARQKVVLNYTVFFPRSKPACFTIISIITHETLRSDEKDFSENKHKTLMIEKMLKSQNFYMWPIDMIIAGYGLAPIQPPSTEWTKCQVTKKMYQYNQFSHWDDKNIMINQLITGSCRWNDSIWAMKKYNDVSYGMSLGGHCWVGLLNSFIWSSHFNSFEDWAPGDFIYRYAILKGVAVTSPKDRTPG